MAHLMIQKGEEWGDIWNSGNQHFSLSLFQLAQQTFQIFQKLLKVTYVRNPTPPGVRGLLEVKINLALCASAAVHLDRPRSTDGRREEEGREGQVLIFTYILVLGVL